MRHPSVSVFCDWIGEQSSQQTTSLILILEGTGTTQCINQKSLLTSENDKKESPGPDWVTGLEGAWETVTSSSVTGAKIKM